MGKKVWHKKSRDGCFTCRQRRVKCDERKPICKNCTRQSLECKFPPSRQLDEKTQRTGSISSETDHPTPVASSHAPVCTPHEQPLLHHFFSNTSHCMMVAPSDVQWMQNFVAYRLMTTRYGVASMLAAAAIHKASQLPADRQSLIEAAYAYRNESLEIVHLALKDLAAHSTEFDVIWLTVEMHCYTRLVLFGSDHNSPRVCALERLHTWLDNWAYPTTVSNALFVHGYDVRGHPWSAPAVEQCGQPLSASVAAQVNNAMEALESVIIDEFALTTLLDFAKELAPRFANFARTRSFRLFTDFRTDLRILFDEWSKGSFGALACIVAYAALLHMIDGTWLINGLGREAILDGAPSLAMRGSEGHQLASWALDWIRHDPFAYADDFGRI